MSNIRKTIQDTFPFGVVALVFVSISILGTLFLKHPANASSVVAFADYLLILGIVGLLLTTTLTLELYSPSERSFNIFGFFVSFLLGMGFVAFLKSSPLSILFNDLFEVFYINETLSQLSVANLSNELSMFIVASIEELMFRVGVPSLILVLLPRERSIELRWLVAIVISSILFGIWHIFAYQGDNMLILSAMVAGVLLSFAYRLGALIGGYDLAFLGIVAGHFYWNISLSKANSIGLIATFIFIVVGFIIVLSPNTAQKSMKYIRGYLRSMR